MTGLISIFTLLLSSTCVSAFTPSARSTSSVAPQRRQSVADISVRENFGFSFAEDSADITEQLLGEANYKQWVGEVGSNSFLNRQYNLLGRVRELDLLTKTADAGILTALEKNGVTLKTLEGLLETADGLGLVSVAGNNQQLLINLVAPLLIEPAPYLLPLIAGALEVGPSAFFLAAAAVAGLEGFLVVDGVTIPFVGLSAGFYLGLLLVPLAGVFAGLGLALQGANSTK